MIKNIALISIFGGIIIIALAYLAEVRLLAFFGALLLMLGLLWFPSLFVAMTVNGDYLYFLILKQIGVEPSTNLTGAFYISVYVLTLFSLIIYKYRIREKLNISKLDLYIFLLFFVYIIAQYAFFSNTAGASMKIKLFLSFSLLPFLIGSIIGSMQERQIGIRILKIVCVFAFISGIYSIYEASIVTNAVSFTGLINWTYHRQTVLLSMAAIFMICLHYFRKASKQSSFISFIVLIVFITILLISMVLATSKSRTLSFVFVLMMIFVYFWYKRIIRFDIYSWSKHLRSVFSPKYLAAYFVFFALIALVLIKQGDTVYQKTSKMISVERVMRRWSQLSKLQDYISGEPIYVEIGNASISERALLIEEQYNEFANSNLIFGVGFANSWDGAYEVHNAYLEVLFETGIIGALLFGLIIFRSIRKIIHVWKSFGRQIDFQDIISPIIMFLWVYFAVAALAGTAFGEPKLYLWTGAILNIPKKKAYLAVSF